MLAPFGEYKRRMRACMLMWDGFSPAKQQEVYARIHGKLERGEFVHENPLFAIEDNSRAPRQPRTFLQPPMNYAGKQLPRTGEFYFADYNGQRGLYKREDVEAHHMSNPEKFEL
jgi:hypothetical protein